MSNDSICIGESVNLLNESDYIEDYIWTFNGFYFGDEEGLEYTPSAAQEFEITLTISNPLCEAENSQMLWVNDYPNNEIIFSNDTLFASESELYQWFIDGEPINNANSSTFIPFETGSYHVETTNAFGCSSSSDVVFLEIISIDELFNSNLQLYPNPLQNEALLRLDGNNYTVCMYNASGKLVRDYGQINSNHLIIKKGDLSPGVYMLHLTNPENGIIKSIKVFIQ